MPATRQKPLTLPLPEPPVMKHVPHIIETGWSTLGSGDMRATCRECGAYAEAPCPVVDYYRIRSAQRAARATLNESCCPRRCTHVAPGVENARLRLATAESTKP